MPKISLLVNHDLTTQEQMPVGTMRRYAVPRRIKRNPPAPNGYGLKMWQQAAKNTAFVGVINMNSGIIYIAPLTPRDEKIEIRLAAQNGMDESRFDSAPFRNRNQPPRPQTREYDGDIFGGNKPIEHQPRVPGFLPKTSHDQMREFANQGVENINNGDYAGFSLRKRDGTLSKTHLIHLRSGTLNSKFVGGGLTMPKDWSDQIRKTLEKFLPV